MFMVGTANRNNIVDVVDRCPNMAAGEAKTPRQRISHASSFPVSATAKNFPIERSPKESAALSLKSDDT